MFLFLWNKISDEKKNSVSWKDNQNISIFRLRNIGTSPVLQFSLPRYFALNICYFAN